MNELLDYAASVERLRAALIGLFDAVMELTEAVETAERRERDAL